MSGEAGQIIMWKLIAGAFGVVIPFLILIIWRKKMKAGLKPAFVGAVIFFVFSQILEGIPKAVFFMIDTPLSQYVWTHAWTYVLIGTLLAGIFEEAGRYVAFRFFLKKYRDRKDAITYGIGHGGIESVLVLGMTGITSIGMVTMIQNGTMERMMSTASIGQQRSMELQIAGVMGYGFVRMLIDILERLITMTLHIALSVVVFKSVLEKKPRYLLVAIVLHAIFDVPAALYQQEVLGRGLAEVLLLISACLIVWYARSLYQKMEGHI